MVIDSLLSSLIRPTFPDNFRSSAIAPQLALALVFVLLSCSGAPAAEPAKATPAKPSAAKTGAPVSNDKPKILDNADIPADMMQTIDQFILHESKTMGGNEYAKEREIGKGPMSSCLGNCYVALYLLEGVPNPGSNNNTQFMVAFTYVAGKPVALGCVQVGGRGLRYVTLKSIGPDVIKLNTETYLPKDPMSTPSGKGHATFIIADKHILEMP